MLYNLNHAEIKTVKNGLKNRLLSHFITFGPQENNLNVIVAFWNPGTEPSVFNKFLSS